MRLMKCCALFLILFTGPRAVAFVQPAQDAETVVVTAAFDGQSLSSQSQVELRLNRALQATEGSLAVFIGSTDITSLLETTQTRLRYRPWPLPLPLGETTVTVYLITPGRQW